MRTLQEFKNHLINRKEPLSIPELLELGDIFKNNTMKDCMDFIDSLKGDFDNILKPNLTPDIKRRMHEGREQEMIDYLKEKNIKISKEEEERIREKFGMRQSKKFIINDNLA